MKSEEPPRPAIVLVVGDQEWSVRSIDSILGARGFAVLRSYSGRQALELARTATPDAIVVDMQTRDIDGFEVCRLVREQNRVTVATPLLMTASASATREDRKRAYEIGAWGFYPQPIEGDVIVAQLRTFLRAKEESDRITSENLIDQVTGLYNMTGLAKRAREIGSEAQRLKSALACIAIAPYTGTVRDILSEDDSAEAVLRVSAVLRDAGRVSDAIGRFGQAEFGVVAPATDAEGVLKLVDRLRGALGALEIKHGGPQQPIGVRVGYCAVPDFADSPIDALEMLLRASAALRSEETPDDGNAVRAFDQYPSKIIS